MGLTCSALSLQRSSIGVGILSTGATRGLFNLNSSLVVHQSLLTGATQTESVPLGYDATQALYMPLDSGGLASALVGVGTLASAISASGNMAADLTGVGDLIPNGNLGAQLSAALTGTGEIATAPLRGAGNMVANIVIGAQPSSQEISDAVWSRNLAPFTTAGTAGKALTDAGSAGNPWSSTLAANNTPGTFGAFIQKLLTVAKFLGLK